MAYHYENVVCPKCKGDGYITTHEYTNYHKGDYDVHFHECRGCNGLGVVKKITTITYEKLRRPQGILRN